MDNLIYVTGDLLDFSIDNYIVHQCNCVTTTPKGLSQSIFAKFPDADIYSDGTIRKMGDIIIRGHVINLLGQYYPSKAKYPNDNELLRIKAFKNGLNKIAKQITLTCNIAFPYKIGCGLAGGKWPVYEEMIKEFANNNKHLTIYIVKLNI